MPACSLHSSQLHKMLSAQAIDKSQGGACNILVTQPRRISAVGVATRIAQERAECVGDIVGYSIRLESKRSAHTRMLFCTTGGPHSAALRARVIC